MQRQDASPLAAASAGSVVTAREHDVGDDAGQGDARRHVVVDAQHVRAQTLIHRNVGARADAGCAYLLSI